MPTASVPRRNKNRRARRRDRGIEPPRDECPPYVLVNTSTAEPPAPPDLNTKTGRSLIPAREYAYALAYAAKFERWLILRVAAWLIPMDDVLRQVELLCLFVEVSLIAAITFPELRQVVEIEEEDDPYWTPRTSEDAEECGLSIERRRPGKTRRGTLPGCQGLDDKGAACLELREYGNRFCPKCEAAERRRIRAM